MRRASAAVALLVLAVEGRALAQDREADAERLFREGQKLLEERRYGEACPKFEAAYRKDGQLGTLLNLAFCHKEQGATWYAWLEFREAEVKAMEQSRADRRDFAKRQLPALEKSLAKLVVDNPKNVPLVEVLVEDRRVPEAEKGAPFAAEPGERKLTFRAKGKKSGTLLVHVVKGDKPMHVATPDLEDMPPEAPPEPAEGDHDGTISRATMPAARAETPESASSQKTLALGVLGVAVVSGVVMGVTGVMTLSNECASGGDRTKCRDDEEGRAESERGKTTATIATVSGVVAGVALVGGAILWFTAPKGGRSEARARVAPRIGLGWAGVAGSF